MKKGKVLCVYSPKGGVGKSIISANIAGSSYLMGKRTLLIDADLYDGGLSLFVNEEIKKNIYTLSNDIKNNICISFRYDNFWLMTPWSSFILKYLNSFAFIL